MVHHTVNDARKGREPSANDRKTSHVLGNDIALYGKRESPVVLCEAFRGDRIFYTETV